MIVLLLTAALLITSFRTVSSFRNQHVKRFQHAGAVAVTAVGLALSIPESYLLQKVIGRLLMPAGLFWAAVFVWMCWNIAHRNAKQSAVAVVFWIGLTLCGSKFVGSWLIGSLEEPWATINAYKQAPFDAVLVLGGGVGGSGDYAQLTESGDRPIVAARMYKRGLITSLVTSGSSIPGLGTYVDVAAATTTVWQDLGIPETAIIRMPEPKNTSEELRAFAALSVEKNWKRMGMVTSAFHMRRAMKLAEANNLEIQPLPSDFKANRSYEGILSWIPDGSGFLLTQKACWEYLGAAVGR